MSLQVTFLKKHCSQFVLLIAPVAINFISLILVVLSQVSVEEANLFKIGLIVLSSGYLLSMLFYLPPLFVLRWIRGQHNFYKNILTCLTILLWSFTPLAIAWIVLATITLFGVDIPWLTFNSIYFWGKALVVPIFLYISYWKLSDNDLYTSFIDSMITSVVVLILLFVGN